MKIWSVANHKGGVGRTTTSLMLARQLAKRGSRVLLVDIDPHASLSRAFNPALPISMRGSYDLFVGGAADAASVPMRTQLEHIDLVVAQDALVLLERRAYGKLTAQLNFTRALQSLSNRYDVAIVDCPAMTGVLSTNAMLACERLIIPTLPDQLALLGLAATYRTAGQLEASRRRSIAKAVLPTMYDRRTRSSVDNTLTLQEQYGADVWPGVIPEDTRLRDPSWMTSAELPRGRGPDSYRRALEWILATSAEQAQSAA